MFDNFRGDIDITGFCNAISFSLVSIFPHFGSSCFHFLFYSADGGGDFRRNVSTYLQRHMCHNLSI